MKLADIPQTKITPTPGRLVLLKYEITAGGLIDTIPAIVIRQSARYLINDHPVINVVPLGDMPPSGGGKCPISGAGEPLLGVCLFDPLPEGSLPEVPLMRRTVLAAKRVWCEWMPYQNGQATKTEDVTVQALLRMQHLEAELAGVRSVVADLLGREMLLRNVESGHERPDPEELLQATSAILRSGGDPVVSSLLWGSVSSGVSSTATGLGIKANAALSIS